MTLEELQAEVDKLKAAKPCHTCGTCPACGAHARPWWWGSILKPTDIATPYFPQPWYPLPTITWTATGTSITVPMHTETTFTVTS